MKKVICITGPTATGKTALAIKLAKEHNGILISADSVQVYKGLDVISGKDIPKDSRFIQEKISPFNESKFSIGYYLVNDVPIYLLDIVDPSYSFSAFDFVNLSQLLIEYSYDQKKVPIIVGGTGNYITSLFRANDRFAVPPDYKLRSNLEEKSVTELQEILEKLNKNRLENLNNSDRNNKRRLVRAIEIEKNPNKKTITPPRYESLIIALKGQREDIKSRIDERVDRRIKEGALLEAETLFKKYKTLSPQVKNANGYKQLFSYLKKEISYEDAVQKWRQSEYFNAKKQMTWLNNNERVHWVEITDPSISSTTTSLIDGLIK